MDTTKWKSILVTRDIYKEIKEIARLEGRTISGQLRVIFEDWAHYVELDRDKIRSTGKSDGTPVGSKG